jgi:hypothetical protein
MLKHLLTAASVALLITLTAVSATNAEPPRPFTPWGTVKIDGANVAAGTPVTAGCIGVQYASALATTQSRYLLNVPGDDLSTSGVREGCRSGETVSFTVDGLPAEQTAAWSSGVYYHLDLTAQSWAPAAPVVTIAIATPNIVLSWPPVTNDGQGHAVTVVRYEVWRSDKPYFVPGDISSPTPVSQPLTPGYVDTGAATDITTNYAYIVRAVNQYGKVSVPSNRRMEFGFALIPGSP